MSDPNPPMWAFVDESHTQPRRTGATTYILAAALVDPALFEGHRAVLQRLRLPGQNKLHWHDETDRRRWLITDAIGALDALHVVVIRSTTASERIERQRRHCLERMVFELDSLGVADVVVESRGPADDRRDRAMMDALRARRIVGPGVRMDHRPGRSEPLLWLPDAVCGATHAGLAGQDHHWSAMSKQAVIHVIELPEA